MRSIISTGAVLTSLPFRWQKNKKNAAICERDEEEGRKKKGKRWRKEEKKKVKESEMKCDDSRCSGKGHAVMHHTVKIGELERVW